MLGGRGPFDPVRTEDGALKPSERGLADERHQGAHIGPGRTEGAVTSDDAHGLLGPGIVRVTAVTILLCARCRTRVFTRSTTLPTSS